MRMPQVSERIKEAPAQALRGVFAGIGQLLLITDKLRNKTPAHPQAPQAAEPPQAAGPPRAAEAPEASAPEPSPASSPAPEPAATTAPEPAATTAPEPAATTDSGTQRDSGKTGNVRLLTEEAGAAGLPAEQVSTESAQAAAPLPNYDELTVASLRARLRNLSVDQVRELAEYERAHAARPEVITMFERRVAKLEADA